LGDFFYRENNLGRNRVAMETEKKLVVLWRNNEGLKERRTCKEIFPGTAALMCQSILSTRRKFVLHSDTCGEFE